MKTSSVMWRFTVTLAIIAVVLMNTGQPVLAASGEAEIRQWLDQWAKAFEAHDLDGIMALYSPDVVAYDIVPPLQYVGKQAYRKDYKQFLSQYDGPIQIEYRNLHIHADGDLAFADGLERMNGKLMNGQKSEMWVRFTSGYKKVNGRWLNIHDHISVPADFATGKAMLELKP